MNILMASGILCAFFHHYASLAFYVAVAAIWLVSDPRIERVVSAHSPDES